MLAYRFSSRCLRRRASSPSIAAALLPDKKLPGSSEDCVQAELSARKVNTVCVSDCSTGQTTVAPAASAHGKRAVFSCLP